MSVKKRICIIDDDKVYTFGIKKIIRNYLPDNQVITFENGKRALEGIKEFQAQGEDLPEVILLDIDMPEMNGWDFLKEFQPIRETLGSKIEVFVISSRIKKNKEELYKMEWDEKVADFIPKPVNLERLKEILG